MDNQNTNFLYLYKNGGNMALYINDEIEEKIIKVPRETIFGSILVSDGSNIVSYEYNEYKDIFSNDDEDFLDKNIKITVYVGEKKYEGFLDKIKDDYIQIRSNNKLIRLKKYDNIEVESEKLLGGSEPEIKIMDQSQIFVNYLFEKIGWNCTTNFIIKDNNEALINIKANINYPANKNMYVNLILINGNILNINGSKPRPEFYAAQSRKLDVNDEDNKKDLEDLMTYNLGEQIIYDQKIYNLENFSTSYEKIYQHITTSVDQTTYFYKFSTEFFIPASNVNIYKIDSSGNLYFSGSDYLKNVVPYSTAKITIGDTNKVSAKSEIYTEKKPADSEFFEKYSKNEQEDNWMLYEQTIGTSIKNTLDKPITMSIKHYVDDSIIKHVQYTSKSLKYKQVGKYLVWTIQIGSGKKYDLGLILSFYNNKILNY